MTAVLAAALLLCPEVSRADQGGGSFWFPGQFASLVAVQQTPGWALSVNYYHSSVAAAGRAAAARQILAGGIPANVNVNLNLSLVGRADLVALTPTYTFATPVLGGQLVAGIAGQYGKATASIAGTLTAIAGPVVVTRSGVLEGSLVSYGDLAPFAQLLWNHGVNNYMAYVTGNIPAGDYDPLRIPNIGLGHGAIDAGGAYTYFDQTTGNEFSGVAGFTYNFVNPDTQYRSGIYFVNDAQKETAERVRDAYDADLRSAGKDPVTTEIAPAGPFYYAEDYHQQYLAKVPNGYCGLGGTGVSCPIGLSA